MLLRVFLTITIVMSMVLLGCSVDENPVEPEPVETELSVNVTVQAVTSLRTTDTWTYWTAPVEVPFVADVTTEDGTTDAGDGHPHKLAVVSAGDTEVLVGSADVAGMSITVTIADGKDMYELAHGGEIHEHHAEAGDHHVVVDVHETATGHGAHGDAVVSHAEIHILAISESTGDTTEIELVGVQGGHGFRYEANAALPYDTFDIHVEVEPPGFFRTFDTQNLWNDHAEFEFHGWGFDSTTSGTVGSAIWVGLGGDSLELSLRAGPVKKYSILVILREASNIPILLITDTEQEYK
jgi:hypothetical protein